MESDNPEYKTPSDSFPKRLFRRRSSIFNPLDGPEAAVTLNLKGDLHPLGTRL